MLFGIGNGIVFAALNSDGVMNHLLMRLMPAPVGKIMSSVRRDGYAFAVGFEMLRLSSTVSPGV